MFIKRVLEAKLKQLLDKFPVILLKPHYSMVYLIGINFRGKTRGFLI